MLTVVYQRIESRKHCRSSVAASLDWTSVQAIVHFLYISNLYLFSTHRLSTFPVASDCIIIQYSESCSRDFKVRGRRDHLPN